MSKERTAFAARLRDELIACGYELKPVVLVKQLALHGKVAVTQQAISGWLNGRHLPKAEAMNALQRLLGNESYKRLVLGGESAREVREPRATWPDHVSGPDRLMFEAFLTLPAKERKVVREMIETLVASAGKHRRG